MDGSRSAIEEIRSRLGITDVISEYVTLRRSGKGVKGLCPFHAEKTPSFTISEEFQTWHCFGCGEHGDIFSFVMKLERLTFGEALERLAKRAGVELERFQDHRPSRRELLFRINSLAATYYLELLKHTPDGLEYLRSRGVAEETIEQFKLGYAGPSWDGLTQYLGKKDVQPSEAAELGLIRRNDRGGHYDWFRQRIIFPIFDIQERIVAFGGRALSDDQPKYLNSPDTPVFSKTRTLYGLNLARKSIADSGCAVIVEGYMDVITAHQAGFSNCVATLGTALTSEHIKLLMRYASKMVLAYDADSAGMKAALRGAAMFEEAECDVRIARLPGGDDPDSIIRKGGTADFSAAVSDALPVVEYKLALLREGRDLSTAEGRAAMLKEAVRVLAGVSTNAEREQYIKALARYHPNFETGTTRAEDHIRRDVDALMRRARVGMAARPVAAQVTTAKVTRALEKAEKVVLLTIIRGEGAQTVLEYLTPEDFSGEVSRGAAQVLFETFSSKKGIYLPEILETIDSEAGRLLSELAAGDAEPITPKFLEECISLIKNSKLKKRRTSDILAPYMKEGTIDPNAGPRGQMGEEYEEFLRKSGRKPE